MKKAKQFDSNEPLMTVEMRLAVKEGEKLAMLNRHPKSVVRIQVLIFKYFIQFIIILDGSVSFIL